MSENTVVPGHRLDEEIYRRLFERRTLLLGEPLEHWNSNRLCNALILLSAEDPVRHPAADQLAGRVGAGHARRSETACGRSRTTSSPSTSAWRTAPGQFLLSAGTKGKRYIAPNAKVLLHQGSAGIGGTAMDIAIQADDLRRTRDTVLGLIAEDTGQDIAAVERDSRRDRWFTAAEALDYGFVDHIASCGDGHPARRPSPDRTGSRPMSSYPIPYVTTRTSQGERTVDIYSRLLAERVVYLGTGIDDGVANAVIAQLIHLESESPDQPIYLYINSPGGSIPATLAIYDAMQYIRPSVETTCVGQAAATAAVLLAGGAPGQAADPAARPRGDPCARGRGTRRDPGPGAGGRRDRAGPADARADPRARTRGSRPNRSARTPSAT